MHKFFAAAALSALFLLPIQSHAQADCSQNAMRGHWLMTVDTGRVDGETGTRQLTHCQLRFRNRGRFTGSCSRIVLAFPDFVGVNPISGQMRLWDNCTIVGSGTYDYFFRGLFVVSDFEVEGVALSAGGGVPLAATGVIRGETEAMLRDGTTPMLYRFEMHRRPGPRAAPIPGLDVGD